MNSAAGMIKQAPILVVGVTAMAFACSATGEKGASSGGWRRDWEG